ALRARPRDAPHPAASRSGDLGRFKPWRCGTWGIPTHLPPAPLGGNRGRTGTRDTRAAGMNLRPRVVAIVPMRHDSERVPGKNYRELGGRPLCHHIITTLIANPRVAETVIDTDSRAIAEDAREAFPSVTIVDRPRHLRGGMVSMNDVLLNDVKRIQADLYIQTHSTNPFLRTESVTRAIDAFLSADPPADS